MKKGTIALRDRAVLWKCDEDRYCFPYQSGFLVADNRNLL